MQEDPQKCQFLLPYLSPSPCLSRKPSTLPPLPTLSQIQRQVPRPSGTTVPSRAGQALAQEAGTSDTAGPDQLGPKGLAPSSLGGRGAGKQAGGTLVTLVLSRENIHGLF